jgi:hypothetical protein
MSTGCPSRGRLRQLGFVSPKCAALANGLHASVGIFIVNNNAQTMDHRRPHVKVGPSQDVRRVASFGQHARRLLALMLRSIAARRERRRCHRRSALRCVSKHEGNLVLILRDARTQVRVCTTFLTCALLRMRTNISCGILHLSNSPSRSRARIAASGLCLFASLTPGEGWAERRETFGCSAEHRWARSNVACQAPSEAPCVP